MDTGCSLEDRSGAIDNKDRWWERVRELHAVSTAWWWWWWTQFQWWVLLTVIGSWCTNTCIASLYVKAAQMIVQYNLIQKLMLYKFNLGFYDVEATKKICCAKCNYAVNHSTRWLEKFCSGFMNLGGQAKSGRP